MVAPATALVAALLASRSASSSGCRSTTASVGKIDFVGLSNYAEVFHDGIFAKSLLFTAEFTLIMTPVQLVGVTLMAMLDTKPAAGGRRLRTIDFVPVVVGTAAGAYAFFVMVQPETGIVNAVLRGTGLTSGYPQWLIPLDFGLGRRRCVHRVENTLDGDDPLHGGHAGGADRVVRRCPGRRRQRLAARILVTVPLLRRTIALVLLLTIVGSFLVFDPFYILTQGGPDYSTLTAVLWVYTAGFVNYRLGYAAALSVALMALLIVVSIGEFLLLRPSKAEEA